MTKLKDQLPVEQMEMQVESVDELRAILAKEDNFKPFGELIAKFTNGEHDYEIYKWVFVSIQIETWVTRQTVG